MIELRKWGRLPDGREVQLAVMDVGQALRVAVSSYGAMLTSIRAPDRSGEVDDILLGFDAIDAYCSPTLLAQRPCFGSTVGRFANRIGGARFTIDGLEHPLVANEEGNQLHGGPCGFDSALWDASLLPGGDGVRFVLDSPDGDQGFPGNLRVTADFRLCAPAELIVRYEAVTDRPTHVNVASHPYFNLAGRQSRQIGSHRLSIAADTLLPTDGAALPLPGPPLALSSMRLNLRDGLTLNDLLTSSHPQIALHGGLNHCFVLDQHASAAVRLYDPQSGRAMEMVTTAPGLQVYTANAFDCTLLDQNGLPFQRHQAIALEAQSFPDSPNRPDFPCTLLRPGEIYISETRYRFFAT
jgi:aldose 1-epimerase